MRFSDLTTDEKIVVLGCRAKNEGRAVLGAAMSPEILEQFEGLSEADQDQVLEFCRSLLRKRGEE